MAPRMWAPERAAGRHLSASRGGAHMHPSSMKGLEDLEGLEGLEAHR